MQVLDSAAMSYGPAFPSAPSEPPPPAPGHRLHPLSFGRLIELSLRMLRFRWRPVYVAVLVLLGPLYVVLALAQPAIATPFIEWAVALEEAFLEVGPGEPLPALPPPPAGLADAIALSLVLGVATGIVTFVAGAAVVYVAGQTYEGREVSGREAVLTSLRRLPSLVGVWLVALLVVLAIVAGGVAIGATLIIASGAGLGAFAGLIIIVAAIVAAVFVSLRWAVAAQAVMLEGTRTLAGLGRSWRIVAGSTWRVLAYLLVVGIILGLVSAVLSTFVNLIVARGQAPLEPTALVVEGLLNGGVAVLLLPVTSLVVTLLYYDLRWRLGELRPMTSNSADQPSYGTSQPPPGWR
jgi:hypothetical protein